MMRWLLPFALLLTLTGYFGPWVDHRVAGLVVTGLDLGEFVKFLPVVREGVVTIWRPGFYAPLIAVSAAASLSAFRAEFAYSWWLRMMLLAVATVAALNLVPPAWTPTRLLEAEFRPQTSALVLLLLGIVFAPPLSLLPRTIVASFVNVLAAIAIIAPLYGYFQVIPAIESLYNQPLLPGWGLWIMVVGQLLVCLSYWRMPVGQVASPQSRAYAPLSKE